MKKAASLLLRQCIDGAAIFRKTADAGISGNLAWSKLGVRDPSLLMDQDGNTVLDEAGRLTLFFNARNGAIDAGGVTCVGIAHGSNDSGWSVQPLPAFADGTYAAQGSVLQLAPDHFRMYYSPDTLRGFALASSTDGQIWTKFGQQLILQPSAFGVRRIGLPFVRRVMDQWVMLFEGIDSGRFHIYLAASKDGISWVPANQGKSIYQPPPGAWDGFGQANPSLYVDCDGLGHQTLYILYNGCSELHRWDVGILSSTALEGPWQGVPAPLLRRGAVGGWDAGRLEGARLIEMPEAQPRVAFFGLPTGDSYAGGQIAFASIDLTPEANLARDKASAANANAERAFNDKLALRYFAIWDHYPIQRFTTAIESRLMKAVIPEFSRVLLLGSGGGRELPVLLDSRCQVTAVDISPQMLAIGQARYPDDEVHWIEADLHDLPRELTGFDAAVCLGAVFNYLRDIPLFLSNVRHALKPGGTLILAAINQRHPSETKTHSDSPDGRSRRLYDLATIREALGSAGFEIVLERGVRFFADMLPSGWNRGTGNASAEAAILDELLVLEEKLLERLPPEQGKFILVHAVVQTSCSAEVAHE